MSIAEITLSITQAVTVGLLIWQQIAKNKTDEHVQQNEDFVAITEAYRELNTELRLKVESNTFELNKIEKARREDEERCNRKLRLMQGEIEKLKKK